MKTIKILNETKDNYKIKDVSLKKIYKLPKGCHLEVSISEYNSTLEIIDSSFYDFKSLLKTIFTFIIMFIPFLLCCSIGMVNMWYGLKVSIDSNDLIEQLVIEKNSNREIKLKNGEKEIEYTLLKGKSALIIFGFSIVALLLYIFIVMLIMFFI